MANNLTVISFHKGLCDKWQAVRTAKSCFRYRLFQDIYNGST